MSGGGVLNVSGSGTEVLSSLGSEGFCKETLFSEGLLDTKTVKLSNNTTFLVSSRVLKDVEEEDASDASDNTADLNENPETNENLDLANFDQETYDALFEAGYSIEEINNIAISFYTNASLDSSSLEVDLNKTPENDELQEDIGNNNTDKDANDILRKLRIKNVNRIVIGSLNINSLPNKFDQLKEVIGKNLDILTIQETKLDPSFPSEQFIIEGYTEPYRLDRNRDGGGVLRKGGHPQQMPKQT